MRPKAATMNHQCPTAAQEQILTIKSTNNQMKKMFPLSTSRLCLGDQLTVSKKSTP